MRRACVGALVACVTAPAACAAALAAAPAAQAGPIGGLARDLTGHVAVPHLARAHAASSLAYNGGPVLHSNRTHLIFWQPSGSGLRFERGYTGLAQTFLADVAADSHKASNVYGLSGQYRDSRGPAAYDSSFGGSVMDSDPLPQSRCVEPRATGPGWMVCLTDDQLAAEIQRVVSARRLPTSWGDVYFLLTPKGLGSCTDAASTSCALGGQMGGYCGYHSQTAAGSIIYAVIPYNAVPGHCQSDNPRPNGNPVDPTLSTISHEHNEMVTDPSNDAWADSLGNEDGDLCITSFGAAIGGSGSGAYNESIHGGRYYLQEEWSNADRTCKPRAAGDSAHFSVRRPLGNRPVTLSGSASARGRRIVAYRWSFGDGRRASGRLVSHRFSRAGTYEVVMRAVDSWGNWGRYARTIRISARR